MIMAAARRLSFAGALVLCLAVQQIAAAMSSQTLRGTVACLDCTPQRNLSGVVVAVKCANGTALRAAETDGRGRFEVAVPAPAPGSASGSRCAARILGGPEQLCALRRFAASRVVVAGRSRRPGSYALASRLAVFTRCASASTTDAAVATTTTATATAETTLAMARLPGIDSPLDYNLGLPLSLLFPFLPIVSGGIP